MKTFKGTKEIEGYEGLYLITCEGEIISQRTWNGKKGRVLKQHPNYFGYMTVSLTDLKGNKKKVFVHKMVALHFVGEKPKGTQIRHLDGNKENNCANNLKYGTAKENAADRKRHGTNAHGSKIGSSKLTEEEVLKIRSSYKKRGDMVKLAEKYNTTCANVYMIINKISRKNG